MGHESGLPVLAHVLFMDIVGCSRLPSDEQKKIVQRLQELVRQSAEFQESHDSDQLISLARGDGMALVFFNKLDAAVQCAVEVAQLIQAESLCKVRMGVNTGPVFLMEDINNAPDMAGAGINRAERVMSCGDTGHILLSDSVADSLRQLSIWQDKIHAVGECRVKDGWIRVWNLVDGPLGNAALPKKSKRHAQRRQMAMAFGAAILALVVAAAVTGAFRIGRAGRGSQSAKDEASIAVLPFADMSSEKNQEYFSDGLAEELLNGLANTQGLRVAGRTSSFQFKGTTEGSRVIGEKLNVATILEGSVRKQGTRARITVELVRAGDGFTLWSETFDREMNDIFAVEQEIARAVVGELKPKLLGRKPTASSPKSTNPEVYNAYLQGRYFYGRRNKENLEKSVDYFRQAVKLDPAYPPAWLGLAKSYFSQADAGYAPLDKGYQSARDAANRALQLDPDMGEAYAAMGWIEMHYDWDWPGADAACRRALALEPGNVTVLESVGTLSFILGRQDEGISLYRRVVRIDPLNSVALRNLGFYLYYAGQQQEAKAALGKALELDPQLAVAHGLLGQVYLAQGQPRAAMDEANRETAPELRLQGLALNNYAMGRKKESDASLAELTSKFADDPFLISEVYGFRKEPDLAFAWLERSYKQRDEGITEIKGDPLLKSLEPDPRYALLLKKMRLPL